MARKKWSQAAAREAIALAKRGLSNREIAERLGVSPISFSRWRSQCPTFKTQLEEARAPIRGLKRALAVLRIPVGSAQGQRLLAEFLNSDAPPQPAVRRVFTSRKRKLTPQESAAAERLLSERHSLYESADRLLQTIEAISHE